MDSGLHLELLLRRIQVPEFRGTVRSEEIPLDAKAAVVILEDAPTSREAQANITSILEDLIRLHGFELVLAEGGIGPLNVTILPTSTIRLSSFPDAEIRRRIADQHLDQGQLGATQYLDIITDFEAEGLRYELVGVEDAQAHADQMAAAHASAQAWQTMETTLTRFKVQLYAACEPYLSDNLVDYYRLWQEHNTDQRQFTDYLEWLSIYASGDIGLLLLEVLEVRRMERSVDMFEAQREHIQFVEQREAEGEGAWNDDELYGLRGFLEYSMDRLTESEIPPEYPNLKQFARLRERQAAIAPFWVLEQVLADVAVVHRTVLGRLGEETSLDHWFVTLVLLLDQISDALQLSLQPETVREFFAEDLRETFEAGFANCVQILEQAGREAELERPQIDWGALNEPAKFYRLAMERSEIFSSKVEEEVRRTGRNRAILVVGGFHSRAISENLRERFTFATKRICPRITKPPEPFSKILGRDTAGASNPQELFAVMTREYRLRMEDPDPWCIKLEEYYLDRFTADREGRKDVLSLIRKIGDSVDF